jgi:hypothetical protein
MYPHFAILENESGIDSKMNQQKEEAFGTFQL